MADVWSFGEVLWDVIDGTPYLGGAPLNFAAHVRRCGFSSGLISAIGADELGVRTRDCVRALDVDDQYLVTDPLLPTGTVEVTLKGGIPSYHICEGVAWDSIRLPESLALPSVPKAFYFGTLAQRNSCSRETLDRLLSHFCGCEVFFDVNLRQSYWSIERLRKSFHHATILKINDEESRMLSVPLFGIPLSETAFAEKMVESYAALKMVVTTCGPRGCLVTPREGPSFQSPATPDKPVDTVGAGDAFSAAFLTTWLKGATAQEAAAAGNRRGGWVASRRGAIPDEEDGVLS